jgi:hypothetical protein
MSGANIERGTKVNLRGLDTGNATRSLMMIDGMRFPGQGNGQCMIDPSIIPAPLARPHRRPRRRRVGDLRLGRGRRRDQHHPEAQHGRRDHPASLDDGGRRQEPLTRLGDLGPDWDGGQITLRTSGTTNRRSRELRTPSSVRITARGL